MANIASFNYFYCSMTDTGLAYDDSLSLLSESEYDKTGDDLMTSRVKRRSKRKSRNSHSKEPPGPKHTLSESTLKRYPKQPTAPPESEDTHEEKTSPKRRRLVGGETETSTETDDSLRPPPKTEGKLRRSSRNKIKRSLSVGMLV